MEVFLTFRGFSADLIAVSSELRAAGSSKLLPFVEKPDKKKILLWILDENLKPMKTVFLTCSCDAGGHV